MYLCQFAVGVYRNLISSYVQKLIEFFNQQCKSPLDGDSLSRPEIAIIILQTFFVQLSLYIVRNFFLLKKGFCLSSHTCELLKTTAPLELIWRHLIAYLFSCGSRQEMPCFECGLHPSFLGKGTHP